MTKYTLRRLGGVLPLLLVASVLVWSMIYLVPGDPALTRLGPNATATQIAAERHAMGLDRSAVVQYVYWVRDALHGDFGRSVTNDETATTLIKNAFPITLNLTIVALLLATIIGLILGIAAARRRDGVAAKFVNAYSSVALAIPLFLVGMLLVWLFSLHLHVLPSSGYTSLLSSPSEYLRHMILPTVTLAFYGSGIMVRFVAAAMNETLGQDYIWTARAKGIRESAVVRRHALRNALIPITTVLGLQLGVMLGGTVITEAVFNLPGMGQLLLSSVERRDYPVVQAEVLYIVLVVAAINIFVDVLYGVLDPRVRR